MLKISSQPQIKFCGLSTRQDIETANQLEIDFIGLVFFPKSPRNVSVEEAKSLNQMRSKNVKSVALVVDAENPLIEEINTIVAPDFFQLHGQEDAKRIQAIRKLTGKPIIKASGVREPEDIQNALSLPLGKQDLHLFDAKPPASDKKYKLPGGNGIVFDWDHLKTASLPEVFILAGGLTPDNIKEALHISSAPIVDVSSGIEKEPGKKSLSLMQQFAHNARQMEK